MHRASVFTLKLAVIEKNWILVCISGIAGRKGAVEFQNAGKQVTVMAGIGQPSTCLVS
jgi:hypothetical protein